MWRLIIFVNSLLLLLVIFASNTSLAIGGFNQNSTTSFNTQTNYLNQAHNALEATYTALALYYQKNGVIPPEGSLGQRVPSGGLFAIMGNDRFGSAGVQFNSSGVPSCLQNKIIKLMPTYDKDSEGNIVIDYSTYQCVTNIGSTSNGDDDNSCSSIPFSSSGVNYSINYDTLGSNLVNCRTVNSSIIGGLVQPTTGLGSSNSSNNSTEEEVFEEEERSNEDVINSGTTAGMSPEEIESAIAEYQASYDDDDDDDDDDSSSDSPSMDYTISTPGASS